MGWSPNAECWQMEQKDNRVKAQSIGTTRDRDTPKTLDKKNNKTHNEH